MSMAEATLSAPFPGVLTMLDELRDVYPPPAGLAADKALDALDDHCRAFIALAPFMLLATADAQGDCDVSPRGGPAGFARVLDERRLLIPDFPGNRRVDSQRNLLENPQAGLLFVIPGLAETLRIQGRAWLTRDPALLGELAMDGRPPKLAIGVEVVEAFLHCAKALKRSFLWERERWPDRSGLPSVAVMLRDHVAQPGLRVEDVEDRLHVSYTTTLY